jgi:hypothetical protein
MARKPYGFFDDSHSPSNVGTIRQQLQAVEQFLRVPVQIQNEIGPDKLWKICMRDAIADQLKTPNMAKMKLKAYLTTELGPNWEQDYGELQE